MTRALQSSTVDRRAMLRGTITLAGAAVVLPGFASLTGCSETPPSLVGKIDLLSALADRVIPATETPGALAAKVPDYIAAVFDQHFSDEQQAAFSHGLDAIEQLADQMSSGGFSALVEEDQDALLQRLTSNAGNNPAKTTFQHVRDLTVFGFYTSESAKQELAYEELPGRYDGCVPLAEIGSAWLERGV